MDLRVRWVTKCDTIDAKATNAGYTTGSRLLDIVNYTADSKNLFLIYISVICLIIYTCILSACEYESPLCRDGMDHSYRTFVTSHWICKFPACYYGWVNTCECLDCVVDGPFCCLATCPSPSFLQAVGTQSQYCSQYITFEMDRFTVENTCQSQYLADCIEFAAEGWLGNPLYCTSRLNFVCKQQGT